MSFLRIIKITLVTTVVFILAFFLFFYQDFIGLDLEVERIRVPEEIIKIIVEDHYPIEEDITKEEEGGKEDGYEDKLTEDDPKEDKEDLKATEKEKKKTLTTSGILEKSNLERKREGIKPMTRNETLDKIAENKLNDMFENQYFDHISPGGREVKDLAEDVGYEFLFVGENLAKGIFEDDQELVTGWMNSPGHRENILNPRYLEIGISVKKDLYLGDRIWMAVQVFALPLDACPIVNYEWIDVMYENREAAHLISKEIDDLKEKIATTRPRYGSDYNEKVEKYNRLVELHNNLIDKMQEATDIYNKQYEERNNCLIELIDID